MIAPCPGRVVSDPLTIRSRFVGGLSSKRCRNVRGFGGLRVGFLKIVGRFPSHPKVTLMRRGADRAQAVGLWTLAGCWSAEHLTDGHVPSAAIRELGCPTAAAKTLVSVGLWHASGHDCPPCPQPKAAGDYVFHDWFQHGNWSREEARERGERLSEVRAAAGRRGGLKSGESRSKQRSKTEARWHMKYVDETFSPVPYLTPEGKIVSDEARADLEAMAPAGVDLDAEVAAWSSFNRGRTLAEPEAALRGWLRAARGRRSTRPVPGCERCLSGWLPDEFGQPSNRRCPDCRPTKK